MVVKCPFCECVWLEEVLKSPVLDGAVLQDKEGGTSFVYEGGMCGCGAIWYEGMEDVEDE
jgi:hypothetical protein